MSFKYFLAGGYVGKDKAPVTMAVRELKAAGIKFRNHLYKYEDHGGTAVCAREFGVDEHIIIKTLVMEDENADPFIVLMHGDMEVSTKTLARQVGAKTVKPCRAETAQKHTGYIVGGTSPFGTKRKMKVYIEETIIALPELYINGGRRGYLVSMRSEDIKRVLDIETINAGILKE
jgi:Cys-tRNA(Pro) deacylase